MRFVIKNSSITENLELTRPFSHIIKLAGLRSGLNIPVTCSVMQLDYQLVTPRRLKITAGLRLTSDEIQLYNRSPVDGLNIYWKNKPHVLPPQQTLLQIEHIFRFPERRPAARKLLSVAPATAIQQAYTLTNRLVINGQLKLQVRYQPR